MEKLPTSRTCDGCDLCCTAAGVDEIAKPAGVRCRHLTALAAPGRNCMIYGRRPSTCASFACLWRASDGALSDDFFPASCGFCLYLNDPFRWPMCITVGVDPARPDAWDRPVYRARFSELAYDLNCIVAIGQGGLASHVFAPSGKVFSKTLYPEFFQGRSVGIHAQEFRADVRLSLPEIAERLLGYRKA